MIFGMTYEQTACYFLIYSFGGWCLEVIYHAVRQGKIINRGFLNGPVCPVYGFGVLAVLGMVHFLPDGGNHQPAVWMIFLGGMVLTTAIEFIAGFLLFHLFHARWWDYSRQPGNIGGYICPLYSVFWGIACVLVVRCLHPLIAQSGDSLLSTPYVLPVLLLLYAFLLIDLIVTALTAAGLNRELDELDKIRSFLRRPSDTMSQVIGVSSMETAQKVDESRVQAALARAEVKDDVKGVQLEIGEKMLNAKEKQEAYKQRYEEIRKDLLEHPHFGKTRLLRAFPDMHHIKHNALLEEIRREIKDRYKA